MPGDSSRLQYLYDRFLSDEASPEEVREFWTRLGQKDEDERIRAAVFSRYNDQVPKEIKDKDWSDSMKRMLNRPQKENDIGIRRWWAAAAVLLMLVSGSYFLFFSHQTVQTNVTVENGNDVAPGGNKAVLTLSNGKNIILDSGNKGLLASQGNTYIMKVDSGLLAYVPKSKKTSSDSGGRKIEIKTSFNTLTTPRGGQYKLMLPDGTKVWLNAASSIRFPTVFAGQDREVQISGEVYFEIAKDAVRPFKVKKGNLTIEVLGTHFNVNAYNNEPNAKVTLTEGRIRVSQLTPDDNKKAKNSQLLNPGEQIQVNQGGKMKLIKNANINKAISWKDGYFSFDNSSLPEVMRQLSRWYDVQVVYIGNMPDERFGGDIPRNSQLSQVLQMLRTSGVKFTIEGRDVRVEP